MNCNGSEFIRTEESYNFLVALPYFVGYLRKILQEARTGHKAAKRVCDLAHKNAYFIAIERAPYLENIPFTSELENVSTVAREESLRECLQATNKVIYF